MKSKPFWHTAPWCEIGDGPAKDYIFESALSGHVVSLNGDRTSASPLAHLHVGVGTNGYKIFFCHALTNNMAKQ